MNELAHRKPDPDAFPITSSEVDWNMLLMASNQFFGRSLTCGLDKWKIKPQGKQALICVLEEFREPGSNPHHSVDAGPLEFLHQSFLVLIPPTVLLQVAAMRELDFLMPPEYEEKEMAILSGTLKAWQKTITSILTASSSRKARQLFGKIVLHFEAMKLSGIFRSFTKVDARDGTFYLKKK